MELLYRAEMQFFSVQSGLFLTGRKQFCGFSEDFRAVSGFHWPQSATYYLVMGPFSGEAGC